MTLFGNKGDSTSGYALKTGCSTNKVCHYYNGNSGTEFENDKMPIDTTKWHTLSIFANTNNLITFRVI